jgi:hypothetical protein
MEPMIIRFVSAVPTRDGRQIRARVRAESKARRDGVPAAQISVMLLMPNGPDCVGGARLPERVYDEALKYLDII